MYGKRGPARPSKGHLGAEMRSNALTLPKPRLSVLLVRLPCGGRGPRKDKALGWPTPGSEARLGGGEGFAARWIPSLHPAKRTQTHGLGPARVRGMKLGQVGRCWGRAAVRTAAHLGAGRRCGPRCSPRSTALPAGVRRRARPGSVRPRRPAARPDPHAPPSPRLPHAPQPLRAPPGPLPHAAPPPALSHTGPRV